MAVIKPFSCIRPNRELAGRVAALPYDVYNREEAKKQVEEEPYSFLKIDRAETQLPDAVDMYDERVYQKAYETLKQMEKDKIFFEDTESSYYIYELIMEGRSQTGITACASIDDYENNIIKKHENTREEKELDRIRHVDTLDAQTGPIFLAYRSNQKINAIVNKVKQSGPEYHFISADSVIHNVWKIAEPELTEQIEAIFSQIDSIYIADGHHRAASAVKVGLQRRKEHPDYDGTEEFNYFLTVLFPDEQLKILPYNRTVSDLNGYTEEEFMVKIQENFLVENLGTEPYQPEEKGRFGMYLSGIWYKLVIKELEKESDCVKALDVSVLQNYLLNPILGITDPRTDKRIDFIGGIRGLRELENRVGTDMKVAFCLYPTSIFELFEVADQNKLMPPKSTWFEPKLRSGLFIHRLSSPEKKMERKN